MRRLVLIALLIVSASCAAVAARPAGKATAGLARVRLETSEGPIVVALETRRAPKTSANFLAYVDDGRFDGTLFYRAARRKSDPRLGMIQGGIGTNLRRALPPVAHEPTTLTGVTHGDATISMARGGAPGSAMGNFFITVGPMPSMDARGEYPGYAAFGHVVSGMEIVRKILADPTCCGTGPMRGQMLVKPVQLIRATRLDGTAKPTGGPKPWLLDVPQRPVPPK